MWCKCMPSTITNSAAAKAGMTIVHEGRRYMSQPNNNGRYVWIEIPSSVRTRPQQAVYLLKRGYMLAVTLLAMHSDKVLVALLKYMHPNIPWKNIHYASKHS